MISIGETGSLNGNKSLKLEFARRANFIVFMTILIVAFFLNQTTAKQTYSVMVIIYLINIIIEYLS